MSASGQQYTDKQIREAIANHEIGGGAPYKNKITKSQANVVVNTKQEFRMAISKANTVVYIDDNVDWDLTGEQYTEFAQGVTVASGRGQNGGDGAILRSKSYQGEKEKRGIFRISKSNVRITGLRMKGPRLKRFKPRDNAERNRHLARGIAITGNNCKVDNCELYGWTEAAISLGAKDNTPRGSIHHNHIHDCQRDGLGYGVDVINGHADIRYNYFNATRHSIDGFGYETCGYTCEYNLFGPDATSHAVDMHCLKENKKGTSDRRAALYELRAGGLMEIRRNTFCFAKNVDGGHAPAIKIRGYPKEGVFVEANRFMHMGSEPYENNKGKPCCQVNVTPKTNWHKMTFKNNQYGHGPYNPDIGAPIDLTAALPA